jgi:uncharacterized protein (DUF305 family)
VSHSALTRTAVALAVVASLSLGLTACGGNDTDANPTAVQTASNGDVFGDADVEFATQMIPHHAQAVQMVAMTQGRRLDPAVRRLAEGIRDAQVPEIEAMTDWLTAWGEEIPPTSIDHAHGDEGMDGMGGMDDTEHGDLPGMMKGADMEGLREASDAAFQDTWLTMMIEHHTGAIEMARTEQADGRFADAVALAQRIESSQRAEIDTMEGLLGS